MMVEAVCPFPAGSPAVVVQGTAAAPLEAPSDGRGPLAPDDESVRWVDESPLRVRDVSAARFAPTRGGLGCVRWV